MDSEVEQLHSWAVSLITKFQQGGGVGYIDKAIVFDREALELRPPGHPNRPVSLTWLAIHLWDRYNQLGAKMDLDEAMVCAQEAVDLRPPGCPGRSASLNSLAVCLASRYDQIGTMEDLNQAIIYAIEALHFPQLGYRELASLNTLSACLFIRYNRLGTTENLSTAIFLNRVALIYRPRGHPDRSTSLNNLAICLAARYKEFGVLEDLHQAIAFDRETLNLCPSGYPLRSGSLTNLANRLFSRYLQLGVVEDLDEAIAFDREALDLCPPGHPERWISLNSLGNHLATRYRELGEMGDLDAAIVSARETLALCPQEHPLRCSSLINLARNVYFRYNQLGEMEDLNETIVLGREALSLCLPGQPLQSNSLNNLAIDLSTRYKQLGAMEDLDEAIVLARDVLALRPPGHPRRSESLDILAHFLHTRFARSRQTEDKKTLFSLYAQLADVTQIVSSTDLSAAQAWIRAAEDFKHHSTLLAYETYLRLLTQHLVTLPSLPQNLTILKSLVSSSAVDAFSACLCNRLPANAVELLEQGRGVFWSQLSRLRSPLDDVVASGHAGKVLADDFTEVVSLIRNVFNSLGTEQHERLCHLNLELKRVVLDIRKLPGFSRFLLPSLFPDLRCAAGGGPVIIVNASKYSCDALVVLAEGDPVHIPLSITKLHVRELSSKLHTLTVRSKRLDVSRDFGVILRELWDDVVSPIVDFLKATYPPQSRIWWCPTAEFTLLPLHAAGPYRKGQRNLSDLYISSYTPTLSSLIRARQPRPRPRPSDSEIERKCFVAIGQAKANGENELLSVGTELTAIGQRVEGLATFTRIDGPESRISRVVEELGKNQWVHLACHGLPNPKQPFESAFALYDGRFSIQHIIRCNLENPEFAYLSACHTTVGDKESPDEMIHLASAMQFAGFRSVIGTMWAVDDSETKEITSTFYKHMVDESGRLDHTRAAFALNKTTRTLVNIPFDQRVLYIHLGA